MISILFAALLAQAAPSITISGGQVTCTVTAPAVDAGVPDSGTVDAGARDAGGADAGQPPALDAGSPDAGLALIQGRQSLAWLWYDFSVLAQLPQWKGSLTHVSPAMYQINYAYDGGVPQFWHSPANPGLDSFSGYSSAQVCPLVHAAGMKCIPLIFAGATNGGTDQGIQNILNDSPVGTQQAFVNALVSEGVAKAYDGWNLDWEVSSGAPTSYAAYGAKFQAFLAELKTALNARGMVLSVDLGTWYVKQTWCSGGAGVADLSALGTSADQFILEDYASTIGPPATACPATLSNPQACGTDFTSALNLMCAYLPPGVVSIGLDASPSGTTPIAQQAVAELESYGVQQVAVWPDWNNTFPDGGYAFMTPAWAGHLNAFLTGQRP